MTAPKLEEEISKNSNGVHEGVFNFKQEKYHLWTRNIHCQRKNG